MRPSATRCFPISLVRLAFVAAAAVPRARPRARAPSLNRTGTAPKWIRRGSVLAAGSLTNRSDRYQPRARDPKWSQNARRKAAAMADRTILGETRGARRLIACCTIPPSGCRAAVPESRLPSRPTRTMWCLAQVHGGASPVAPPTTMWIRALVLPASWPSPPCAKATAGTVARISERAMTMCLSFKLSPLLDPADAAAPEPSESAHPGYLRRIGFPSGCHEPWLAGTLVQGC